MLPRARNLKTSAANSPEDLQSSVFAFVEEELAGDALYFLLSLLSSFTVQLLARSEHHVELGLFTINKILEPSKEVALQLLESGCQNFQTRKLGLDMLRQLIYIMTMLLLLQNGYYLEALRYAQPWLQL